MALTGEANLLITVDKDLLTPKEFQGIATVKPGSSGGSETRDGIEVTK